MPLSWALKFFILALKDSAEALVDLLSKKFRGQGENPVYYA